MKAPQDILHEKSPASSQLNYSESLSNVVGEGVDDIDRWGLHENSKPGGNHLSKERRYLRRCGEVSFFGKNILMAIVPELFICKCLLPVFCYFEFTPMTNLLDHNIS